MRSGSLSSPCIKSQVVSKLFTLAAIFMMCTSTAFGQNTVLSPAPRKLIPLSQVSQYVV